MPENPKNPDDSGPPRPTWQPWVIAGLMLALFAITTIFAGPERGTRELPYSDVKEMIRSGQVTSAVLEENAIVVTRVEGATDTEDSFRAVTPAQGDPTLLPLLEEEGIEISARAPAGGSVLAYLLPWIIIIGVYVWLQRRMMGGIAGGPGGLTVVCWAGGSRSPANPPKR